MKIPFLISSIFILAAFFTNSSALARYYRCDLGKAATKIYITTRYGRVLVEDRQGPKYLKILKMVRSRIASSAVLRVEIENNEVLEIDLSQSGRDGVTQFNYPYRIDFRGAQGGCETEEMGEDFWIERIRSEENQLGRVIVGYWPGEESDFRGFAVTKNVVLPPSTTWYSLMPPLRENRTCTLTKGTLFSPEQAKASDEYAFIVAPEKHRARIRSNVEEGELTYQRGDIVTTLAPLSEGYCLIEKGGSYHETLCIRAGGAEFRKVNTRLGWPSSGSSGVNTPRLGHYVFTRCGEGHFTWISVQYMKADSSHFQTLY